MPLCETAAGSLQRWAGSMLSVGAKGATQTVVHVGALPRLMWRASGEHKKATR
jgi:hypothetical protein